MTTMQPVTCMVEAGDDIYKERSSLTDQLAFSLNLFPAELFSIFVVIW